MDTLDKITTVGLRCTDDSSWTWSILWQFVGFWLRGCIKCVQLL